MTRSWQLAQVGPGRLQAPLQRQSQHRSPPVARAQGRPPQAEWEAREAIQVSEGPPEWAAQEEPGWEAPVSAGAGEAPAALAVERAVRCFFWPEVAPIFSL